MAEDHPGDRRIVRARTEQEVNRFMAECAAANIAPAIDFQPAPENIRELLGRSECLRCGACCLPDPANPSHPGVEVFEEEMKAIARYLQVPLKTLVKKTRTGRRIEHPYRKGYAARTRWLPLPCMFYDSGKSRCRVYEVRPAVCRLFPLTFGQENSLAAISVRCGYGKDLYRYYVADA